MKIILSFVAFVLVSCSGSQSTKQDGALTTENRQHKTITPQTDCEGVRSKILSILGDRIPELETIGTPYLSRISNGTEKIVYSYVHCPEVGAADSMISQYYSIGAGDGTERSAFWYQIFIGKDFRTVLISEMMQPPLPLDQMRSSEKWKTDWRSRR